jgi:NADH:ubiquinone oxidoreductase subunit C
MFEKEESIVKSLTGKFDFFNDNCRVTRERRIFAQAPREHIVEVAGYAKNALKFGSLCTITGLDMGEDFQLIYHLANDDGIVLNVKVNAPKSDPVVQTVTGYYEGGMLYEIEIRNLLGVDIKGVPEDIRYPLPDGWPEGQHPLRKDWQGEMPEIKPEGEC